MRCPQCRRETGVTLTKKGVGLVMRARRCRTCAREYRTEEKIIGWVPIASLVEARRQQREQWHHKKGHHPA